MRWPCPALVLLSGLPGAGKTTFAAALLAASPAVHLESDAIRRRFVPTPRYTRAEHAAVFGRLETLAGEALAGGHLVVVDATNLTPHDRRRFFQLAQRHAVPVVAARLTAPLETLRARLSQPREGWSQAGPDVLQLMQRRPRPFTVPVVVVDSRYDIAPSVHLVLRLVSGFAP